MSITIIVIFLYLIGTLLLELSIKMDAFAYATLFALEKILDDKGLLEEMKDEGDDDE
jgi:hypothetical protein